MAEIDRLQYEYFSSVRQRKVEWLWYPYIPYGKLTILQGDPGEGTSFEKQIDGIRYIVTVHFEPIRKRNWLINVKN